MFYFAYGSNMSTRRLLARTPSAEVVTPGRLDAHSLRFHAHGADDSGKCDALPTGRPDDCIHGVIWALDPAEKPALDACEELGRGYAIKQVEILTAGGGRHRAFTYCALRVAGDLQPFDWYKRHVLAGAREHGLPESYIRVIEAVCACADPDAERHARETALYRR